MSLNKIENIDEYPISLVSPIIDAEPMSTVMLSRLSRAAPEESIPRTFSWRSTSDVLTRLGKPGFHITTPVNQHRCGNCWACAIALAVTDRILISRLTGAPQFGDIEPITVSIRWLSTCNVKCAPGGKSCSAGCRGANLGTALKFLALDFGNGLVSEKCLPWDDAKHLKQIETNKSHFKNHLQVCQEKNFKDSDSSDCYGEQSLCGKCDPEKKAVVESLRQKNRNPRKNTELGFFLTSGSINTLPNDSTTVKQIIYLQGPITASFLIFEDMQSVALQKNTPLFESTKGIYIHNGSQTSFGFHAVTIVGWGTDDIILPQNVGGVFGSRRAGIPTSVDYWVVRNSWGSDWGNGGYWKHAMQNSRLGINLHAGLEGLLTDYSGEDASGNIVKFSAGSGGIVDFKVEVRETKILSIDSSKMLRVPSQDSELSYTSSEVPVNSQEVDMDKNSIISTTNPYAALGSLKSSLNFNESSLNFNESSFKNILQMIKIVSIIIFVTIIFTKVF
jgi:hypothetical protein